MVAKFLRCGGIFNDYFIANDVLLNASVKIFWKIYVQVY